MVGSETGGRRWMGFGLLLVVVAVILAVATALLVDALSTGCREGACVADSPDPVPAVTGPLALHRAGRIMAARDEGRLVIEETCVFLERGGERQLLIWPDARTRWHEPTRTIDFLTMDDGILTLQDGQEVVLGGGSIRAENLDWVAPPKPECLAWPVFEVGEVEPLR